MRDGDVSGLLGSAGKAIARMHNSDQVAERIRRARTAQEFREILEASRLGMAEPASRLFIERVTGAREWRDYRSRLLLAWDVAYNNRLFPGS